MNVIESRLSELQNKSFSELSGLLPHQAEKVRQAGKTLVISVWKDVVSETELRIVVQVYRHFCFGIGRMMANGFRMDRTGTIHELSRKDLYDFL
jgi:hypothetical protein